MAATKQDIREWLLEGKRQGATHVIIVCDTFDHDDYPIYVSPSEKVHDRYEAHNNKNMQRVMEVYNLSMNVEQQLNEERAFHF